MTNNHIRRRFDAFDRIRVFGTKHDGVFAPTSRGRALFAKMEETVATMREAGASKLSGTGKYRGGTGGKVFWYGELEEDLRAIRDTAVAISEAEGTPEFDDQFRIPRTSAYDAMLVAARAFLKDATPHKALFLEFEMPEDFLEDLADDIAKFERAGDDQDAGRSDQVGGTADLSALATQGMKIRKQLDPIVRNKFKGNAAVLAAWQSAQHIERPPRGEPPSEEPPSSN